jgi:transcriptional regulator with XRE-family HTH domain
MVSYIDIECCQMESFSIWLENELRLRGMSPADLARASGKAPAVISRILNNERKPSNETLKAIARGLGLPIETVFRAAGLLPPISEAIEEEEELLHLFRHSTPEERKEILEWLRFRAERKKAEIKKPSRERPAPAQVLLKE